MKAIRWTQCNVLDARLPRRLLWHFGRDGHGARLSAERAVAPDDALPAGQVGRTLQDLWRPKLNVAWLPANQVFLRVIQLPPGDPKELPAMVELQIEKLSPLPVAQTVWTYEVLPGPPDQPLTTIVAIVPRALVETYLGELEETGYLADRLTLPILQELLATPVDGDGIWVYPREEGLRTTCLVAWWQEGKLQNLNLLALPGDATAGKHLTELLKQLAWAGEMEGWLGPNPTWNLVAAPTIASQLEPALRELSGSAVNVREPLSPAKVAELSAATGRANLVPPEFATRYRQQFIDRLWMRGLGALGVIYLLVVLAYFAALQIRGYQKDRIDQQVAGLGPSYTKALQLKAKVQILQEQVNLKFAALDCLKAASEALPEEMTLTQLSFQRGKKLGLFGTVPADQQAKVTAYNQALAAVVVNGQQLFTQVVTKSIQGAGAAPGNRPMNWSIECEIKRSDLP